MKILERTIFKKKNEEIEKLKQELINVSKKSAYNYERNKELNNTILDLSDEIYVLRKILYRKKFYWNFEMIEK